MATHIVGELLSDNSDLSYDTVSAAWDMSPLGLSKTWTSGGTDDKLLDLSATLNDSGAAGGSDVFRAIKTNITATDVTGWDSVYVADFQYGGNSILNIENVKVTVGAGDATTQLILPSSNDQNTPTLAFVSDTGFYESSPNSISVAISGGRKWTWWENWFYGFDSGGPALLNETASATNPTMIPDRADATAGYGGLADATPANTYLSSIINSTEITRTTATRQVTKKFQNLDAVNELTIATGAITATKSYHSVDTESDGATDDLDTISGGSDGDILVLVPAHTDRTVVVKDGTGNINCAGDFSMDNTGDTITLLFDGSNWLELSRSAN